MKLKSLRLGASLAITAASFGAVAINIGPGV